MELTDYRREFADRLLANRSDPAGRVHHAFARVPREHFAGNPPWLLRHNTDLSNVEETDDARLLYQDVTVAIDPARRLSNGAPSLWAMVFAALDLSPGDRVLQIGTGLGYYSAILAEVVGPEGSVTACEVDHELAERARANLEPWSHVEVRAQDGALPGSVSQELDGIVAFAGATHVVPQWLDALADGGQLYIPLTINLHDPIGGIGVGVGAVIQRRGDAFEVRSTNPVGIYPCASARTEHANAQLHAAFQQAGNVSELRSVRRDAHDAGDACWCHIDGACLSRREVV